MLELCWSLYPINPVTARHRDQQPWMYKIQPQHGSCHQLIRQSLLFNPALNRRENTQGTSSRQTLRKSHFFQQQPDPPVQCEARISTNPQKHTNIVLQAVIDKEHRLYTFSVLLIYTSYSSSGVGAKVCGNTVHISPNKLVAGLTLGRLDQWKSGGLALRCPQGPMSEGISGIRYPAYDQPAPPTSPPIPVFIESPDVYWEIYRPLSFN